MNRQLLPNERSRRRRIREFPLGKVRVRLAIASTVFIEECIRKSHTMTIDTVTDTTPWSSPDGEPN